MRSLIELPGLKVSSFTRTVAGITPRVMLLIRTSGVCPMASRMLSQMSFGTDPLIIEAQARRHP